MNTGKNYNTIVHGSGINKLKAKISTLNSWLQHPEMKRSYIKAERSKIAQYADFLSSVMIHGATLQDYLIFEFYKKSNKERRKYVTGKKLHRFFDDVNNKDKTDIFIEKDKFVKKFKRYLGRDSIMLDLDGNNISEVKSWLNDKSIVFAKPSKGVEGRGVTKIEIKDDIEKAIEFCLENNLDLIEEAIIQHVDMNILYPDAINTVRFITFVRDGNVEILGASLRMGNGGHVDNAAGGGVYASVDVLNGTLDSYAFNSDGDKFAYHPITGHPIMGFQIPMWSEVIEICKNAALEIPDVRCIGWDVALSKNGPLLIEGNDRWSRFVWQHPKERGLYDLIK